MTIRFTLDPAAHAPTHAHADDAGWDLYSTENKWIPPHSGVAFDTGVHIAIPAGYFGRVAPRSGLNIRRNIASVDGIIDSGYTGSIVAKLYNQGNEGVQICQGDKIAQLIIQPFAVAELEQVQELPATERGNNGFGSSGR